MPDAWFVPRVSNQEGWSNISNSETYRNNPFGDDGFHPGRSFVTRFTNVDIPVGATITSAHLFYNIHAKNPQDAQNMVYNHAFDAASSGSGTMKQDALPLRRGVYEDDPASSGRYWTAHVATTFNWPSSPAGTYIDLAVDVTSQIQAAFTSNAGRHMALAFRLYCSSESGDLACGNTASQRPVRLKIIYSGGTTPNEIVNYIDDCNFTQGTYTMDNATLPLGWQWNSFYGAFAQPVVTTAQSFNSGAIVAPKGGNVVMIDTSVHNKDTAIFIEGFHGSNDWGIYEFVPGEWLCLSAFVWAPSSVARVRSYVNPQPSEKLDSGVSNAWTRIYTTFQYSIDYGIWMGFSTEDLASAGEPWYLANVNLTRGRELYRDFDGNSPDEPSAGRTYEWGGGNVGKREGGTAYCAYTAIPTATMNSLAPASTYKNIGASWVYSSPNSETQASFIMEIRDKKVP